MGLELSGEGLDVEVGRLSQLESDGKLGLGEKGSESGCGCCGWEVKDWRFGLDVGANDAVVLKAIAHKYWFPKTRWSSVGQVALPCHPLMLHRHATISPTPCCCIHQSRYRADPVSSCLQISQNTRTRWYFVTHFTMTVITRPWAVKNKMMHAMVARRF